MSPDEIKALIEDEFPELVPAPRRNPDGWAFYYRTVQRNSPSTRIARAVRRSDRSPTIFKKAVTARRDPQSESEVVIDGGAAQVRELIHHELEIYKRLDREG